jgi:hypothetical protein
MLGSFIGLSLAVPLGPWMQANVTTSANMHGVRGIRRSSVGGGRGILWRRR